VVRLSRRQERDPLITLANTIANGTRIIAGHLDSGSANHTISVCGADSVAKIWNLDTGALVRAFAGHTDMVWTCELSADRTRLVTTSSDGTAKLWDVASGKILQSFAHGGIVFEGHLSRDGQTLVTSGVRPSRRDGGVVVAEDTGTAERVSRRRHGRQSPFAQAIG